MHDFQFTLDFQVRDYECDYQGIVNNAVYLNYLEHTRHEFINTLGINVVEMARQGINLIVIRAEIDYKYPLRSGDAFMVGLNMQRMSRVRFAFDHELYHSPSERLILQARFITTAINNQGRPCFPKELEILFPA